jgi:hypothetical protein
MRKSKELIPTIQAMGPALVTSYIANINATLDFFLDIWHWKKFQWSPPIEVKFGEKFYLLVVILNLFALGPLIYSGNFGVNFIVIIAGNILNTFLIRTFGAKRFLPHVSQRNGWSQYCGTFISYKIFETIEYTKINNTRFISAAEWVIDNVGVSRYDIYDPYEFMNELDLYQKGKITLDDIDFGGTIAFVFKHKSDAMLFRLTHGGQPFEP